MHLTLLCLCRCPVSGLQWGPSENKTRLLCCSSWTDLNVFRMHNFALLMLPNIHIRRRWCTLHRHHYCPDGFNGAAGLFFFFPEVLKWCTLTLMCYWMGPGIVFCLFSIMPLSMRPISSLENVLQKRGRCLQKEKKKREKNHVSWQFSCRDWGVMCILKAGNHPAITVGPGLMVLKSPLKKLFTL